MFLSQPQHWQGLYVVANPADKAAITKLRKVIMLGPSSHVTRIVKAALHKSPGKSNLNFNFVSLDYPVCSVSPVCPISPVCLVCPVCPDDHRDLDDNDHHGDHDDHVD